MQINTWPHKKLAFEYETHKKARNFYVSNMKPYPQEDIYQSLKSEIKLRLSKHEKEKAKILKLEAAINEIGGIKDILAAICFYYNISQGQILEHQKQKNFKKFKDIYHARHVAMYIARELTKKSYKQIAYAFNRKDHTTVMAACEKIKNLMQDDADFRQEIENLIEGLK